jgi:hypothetical protein
MYGSSDNKLNLIELFDYQLHQIRSYKVFG